MPVVTLSGPHEKALNYVANQELKALTYTGLVDLESGTKNNIVEQLNHTTGLETGNFVRTYPDTFELHDFAQVTRAVGRNGRTARFFQPLQEEIALPVIGATLSWSVDNPQEDLTKVIGTSSSKGESAGPMNSIQLFDGFLKGLKISDMHLPGYRPSAENWQTAHNSRLKTLVAHGIVQVEDDQNRFRIVSADYKGSVPFGRLSLPTRVAYQTLRHAIASGQDARLWTTSELVKMAVDQGDIPADQADRLDDIFVKFASKSTPKYGSGTIDKIDFRNRCYALDPLYTACIAQLIERIKDVDTGGQSTRERYTDVAQEIYHDRPQAQILAQKAMDASPFANRGALI